MPYLTSCNAEQALRLVRYLYLFSFFWKLQLKTDEELQNLVCIGMEEFHK